MRLVVLTNIVWMFNHKLPTVLAVPTQFERDEDIVGYIAYRYGDEISECEVDGRAICVH